MAKIAVKSSLETGEHLAPARRILAQRSGWAIAEVICCAGPRSRVFEEQHSNVGIAMVLEGSFQYRSRFAREVMTPGSLLLGNAGEYYECSHEHAAGDRCLSFTYSPEYFESIAAESGFRARVSTFQRVRVPPVRPLSSLFARVSAALRTSSNGSKAADRQYWDDVALEIAGRALESDQNGGNSARSLPSAEARVTRVIRRIEAHPGWDHDLDTLADEAKLSRYHFLRVFQEVTGITPHRYVLRMRLRTTATRAAVDDAAILDIALDSGFGDISNFNRAFRAEFGMSPRAYRSLNAV